MKQQCITNKDLSSIRMYLCTATYIMSIIVVYLYVMEVV